MPDSSHKPSIFDLRPLETGGVQNREGLSFQDHVAAGFCLAMLLDPSLEEVWCETQDDITLIQKSNGTIQVEFLQVKSNEPDQLWSVSMLCEREGKAIGTSILEKSLANDRCAETVNFRLITLRPVKDELKILLFGLTSAHRNGKEGQQRVSALQGLIRTRVGDFKSDNGNNSDFWVERATWEEKHSEQAVQNENLLFLSRFLEEKNEFLTQDQKSELYAQLVAKVWSAGKADYDHNPTSKRVTKKELREWIRNLISRLLHPAAVGTGEEIERKMREAGIPRDTILLAQELRRSYRREVLNPQYLAVKDRQLMEGEILATLQALKAELDAGLLNDSGVEFHQRCLGQLKALQETLGIHPKPPFMFLEGYMYNVVDRCLHRFTRAGP